MATPDNTYPVNEADRLDIRREAIQFRVNRNAEDPSDGILYHYTSAAGLDGILNSGIFRATSIFYLNDHQEMKYGVEALRNAFREECVSQGLDSLEVIGIPSRERTIDALQLMDSYFESMIFAMSQTLIPGVVCFSSRGDTLSQWRGYGNSYAIGFDFTKLKAHTLAKELPFTPVAYGTDHQGFRNFVSFLVATLKAGPGSELVADWEQLEAPLVIFGERAVSLCAQMKDDGFNEEAEWRIINTARIEQSRISTQNDDGAYTTTPNPDRGFRPSSFGLTPYSKVDLRQADGLLPINEIYLSPGSDDQLRYDALHHLLRYYGYDNVTIHLSKIPYRTV